jgi:3-isopropylmalate/(R)-2-methylmalate dehydratase small subunit
MAGWTVHSGSCACLPLDNVDTDQLIPARFMSVSRSQGYGDYLLHDLRRDANGVLLRDFVLNRHANISILVSGRNFGSGSSREAAVYALADAGIRAVIAPGFGDIFAANAVNNGLLPARVSPSDAETLFALLGSDAVAASVDLEHRHLQVGGRRIAFQIEDLWRTKLMKGWDDIDLTRSHGAAIDAHRTHRRLTAPSAWPPRAAE